MMNRINKMLPPSSTGNIVLSSSAKTTSLTRSSSPSSSQMKHQQVQNPSSLTTTKLPVLASISIQSTKMITLANNNSHHIELSDNIDMRQYGFHDGDNNTIVKNKDNVETTNSTTTTTLISAKLSTTTACMKSSQIIITTNNISNDYKHSQDNEDNAKHLDFQNSEKSLLESEDVVPNDDDHHLDDDVQHEHVEEEDEDEGFKDDEESCHLIKPTSTISDREEEEPEEQESNQEDPKICSSSSTTTSAVIIPQNNPKQSPTEVFQEEEDSDYIDQSTNNIVNSNYQRSSSSSSSSSSPQLPKRIHHLHYHHHHHLMMVDHDHSPSIMDTVSTNNNNCKCSMTTSSSLSSDSYKSTGLNQNTSNIETESKISLETSKSSSSSLTSSQSDDTMKTSSYHQNTNNDEDGDQETILIKAHNTGSIRGKRNNVRESINNYIRMCELMNNSGNLPRNFQEEEQNQCILYVTSLSVIRSTLSDSKKLEAILENHFIRFEVRDVYINDEFRHELLQRLNGQLIIPALFMDGKFLGSYIEVEKLNETGTLVQMLERFRMSSQDYSYWLECQQHKKQQPTSHKSLHDVHDRHPQQTQLMLMAKHFYKCQRCGNKRFINCLICHGSGKHGIHHFPRFTIGLKCTQCSGNGLVRCPDCSQSPQPQHITRVK